MENKLLNEIANMSMSMNGKSLISSQFWTKDELDAVLNLAVLMKNSRFHERWRSVLPCRTFLMFFYNQSIRTRTAFEAGVTELGGHAQFFMPLMARLKTLTDPGETIEDFVKVMSRYVSGIGLRVAESALPYYGAGNQMLLDYIKHSSVPVINMANDMYHPCQGFADILGFAEHFGIGNKRPDFSNLKKKNLLLTWGRGKMVRTWSSVQETLLIASRYGMNITLARPDGYDLDPNVYRWTKENCDLNGSNFNVINDPDSGYSNAHIVYSRNWMSIDAYKNGVLQTETETRKAAKFVNWTTDSQRIARTDNAVFTHCMPIDRGTEVTDDIANMKGSIIYEVAENKLHVQKAILALLMGDLSQVHF